MRAQTNIAHPANNTEYEMQLQARLIELTSRREVLNYTIASLQVLLSGELSALHWCGNAVPQREPARRRHYRRGNKCVRRIHTTEAAVTTTTACRNRVND